MHGVGVVTHDSVDALDGSATSLGVDCYAFRGGRVAWSDGDLLEIVLDWTFQKRVHAASLVVLAGVGLGAVTVCGVVACILRAGAVAFGAVDGSVLARGVRSVDRMRASILTLTKF